jgi:transposase
MKRFVEGEDRTQVTLLPESLDDYVAADNPVRVIDVFVDELDLHELGFVRAEPAATGRPSYHPGVLLKIYLYGYLNRIQSSRRLEREAQRNVELIWLTGRTRQTPSGTAQTRSCSRSLAALASPGSGTRSVDGRAAFEAHGALPMLASIAGLYARTLSSSVSLECAIVPYRSRIRSTWHRAILLYERTLATATSWQVASANGRRTCRTSR